jgi:hypothetical protein
MRSGSFRAENIESCFKSKRLFVAECKLLDLLGRGDIRLLERQSPGSTNCGMAPLVRQGAGRNGRARNPAVPCI